MKKSPLVKLVCFGGLYILLPDNMETEDPDCFWVAVKGRGPYIVDETEYKSLHAEMNLFYDKSQDTDEVKPVTIEEGQICVVFSEELKCWCRAVIKSIIYCTDHYQTKCFFVDYAKYVFVKSKDIRVALEAFIQIPYRAKKCRLYGIKPMTLHISFYEDTAKMIPTNRWDSAAIEYFQHLLKAATEVKVQLHAVEDSTYHVFLYVTIKDEKVCVNDDLAINNFAAFKEAIEENTRSSADHQKNQTSLNADFFPVKIVNPALAFRPVLFQEKIPPNPDIDLIFLIETCQRLSTDLNGNTAFTVKAIPSLPFKEDPVVHIDEYVKCFKWLSNQSFPNLHEEKNFVFLSNKIEPVSLLETAPLSDDLKKELTRKKFVGPNFTESYCWPPVARGCDVLAISWQGNDPLVYIPPLLTRLQLESCYKALPKRDGPLALILCPGWKKAQLVFELLKTYRTCSGQLHPMLVILGQNKEAGSVKIQGCEVIVTTPCSLLRLFEHQGLLLCRLCHVVLDEIEVLFSDAAEQVFAILDCCKKAFGAEKLECSPQQIIAVGTRWHKHIAPLTEEFMNDPYVVITAVEEASIYGNVQQVVQPCMNSERTAVLLKILGCTPSDLQKVLVFTDSVNEAEMVHEALKSSSITSLKIHKESKFNFKYTLEQWTKKNSSGTRTVLVLTDDCMQSLGITDATCVIHFSLPSPRILGQRLHSMSDSFCNVVKASVAQEYTKARSVILLTENNECRALEILQFLQHAGAEIPPELHSFTAKMLEAEEEKKLSRPLCAYLKTFGICKNRTTCPDRHQINVQIDVAQNILDDKITQLPGCVTILPLNVVNATNYFGRIVDKEKDQYTILAEEMKEYFEKPSNKISATTVQKLGFYGLCEQALFHRVQVVEISPKEEENLVFNVKIKYIDEGRTSQVQNYHLLHLPAKFQCLPPQAVEFVLCRVKPIDNELEWNPKVTHYINQKIKGKLHEAKIVHTLGNTAWVDPMVRVTRIPALKITVNEYSVRAEILSTGLGADNPEHITQLQKLCGHMKLLDCAENLEPLGIKEGTSGPESTSSPQNVSIQEKSTENCNSSGITVGNNSSDGVAETKEAEEMTLHQRKCFYPEIKWFQNEETVTVKVKIARAADCKCEFSKEKVVFSACSGDKLYLADVELHRYILAERSTCVIKDKEVIIVLTKEKKGAWCKLPKNKNPHVSFDFEHWEELEDETPFPVGKEELYCTATVPEELSDYSEDSGTEDDE
ncbi:putative ATP-dependent RNA helicase TDRD12 [Indicator indicator]|uniref:putative ATP-dependent RNA helicase TDRD12 n=1 Tax=Indicator indicator TaxID=1002788 RepID=UPI0023DE8736|nr:putative ATP-dependent RNA helicase TDRD12 [Indicator indicator]